MDLTTFLRMIVPATGIKFAQRIRPRAGKRDATILYPVGDHDDLRDKLLELDHSYPAENVYYAMASYKETQFKTVKTKDGKDFEFATGRTQDNALHVKALWFDMDVGKLDDDGELRDDCYATQRDAAAALANYCEKTGMPTPLLVTSGYGLHCYWPFTNEVQAYEWKAIAKIQRAAWQHLGMKVDSACDLDCARVLRAPGTHNKKPGKEPKLVRVLKETSPLPAGEYKRILKGYVERNHLSAMIKADVPEWAKGAGNLFGVQEREFPDSFAAIAVDHCQQLQEFRKTGGTCEPIWYRHLGLMRFFKDGDRYAHEWSAKYAGYDEDETQFKYESWGIDKPPTCAWFRENGGTACEGCKRTCTAPTQLGLDESVTPPNLNEIAEEAAHVVEDSAITAATDSGFSDDGLPLGWPERYGYDSTAGQVTVKVKDADGLWQQLPIANCLFYPVEQIRGEDGTYLFKMHAWVRGKVREFELPTKYTADARSLKMQLHANQVQVLNDKEVASYMSQFMTNMQRLKEETETYRQMGWKHGFKGWLIGDTLITEKEAKRVALSQSFSKERRNLYDPKGDPNKWVHAVDTLYNREHGEPYQFAICAAFAAPLHELLGFSEWRGIPFALTTNESGFGKTTVNMIANSIWYDPEKGKISNATAKAVLGIASEFNNLPFLLDEVTSYLKDPTDMGDLLYSLSNGRGREGMGQSGGLRDMSPSWIGTCCMTGNRNILMQVSENKLNPEAMQMRVFEIDLDVYPRISTMAKGSDAFELHNASHRLLSQTLVSECSGVVGTDYVRWVMRNIDEVKLKLRKTSLALSKLIDNGDATKERFYYNLITTVLVGGWAAKKMGFVNFDMNNLRDWCIAHVNKLRYHSKEFRCTPQDHFAALMSDLVGRVVITKNYETLDARKGKTELHQGGNIRTGVCGRYVRGDEKERTQLYVSVSAIQQWCIEQGISYPNLRRDFIREGIIRMGRKDTNRATGAVRISLGKGVTNVGELGVPWCVELDADKASGLMPAALPATVTELKAVAA